MILHKSNRKVALVSGAFLSVALLAGPAFAQSASTQAQAAMSDKVAPGSPAGTTESETARSYSTPELVEARIAELHHKLGIVASQEPYWNSVADTMRDNAQAMEEVSTAREQSLQTMTVMDDLKSYETMARLHADGLHKLVVSFGQLYDSMSPDQKIAADSEFQGYRKSDSKQ
jgi:LTXXQ motif family protein